MKKWLKAVGLVFLYLAALPLLSLTISYISGFVVISKDYTEEATVGIIAHCGIPIWFYAHAPGISIMSGWHVARFLLNAAMWYLVLLIASILIQRTRHKRCSNQASDAIGVEATPQHQR